MHAMGMMRQSIFLTNLRSSTASETDSDLTTSGSLPGAFSSKEDACFSRDMVQQVSQTGGRRAARVSHWRRGQSLLAINIEFRGCSDSGQLPSGARSPYAVFEAVS